MSVPPQPTELPLANLPTAINIGCGYDKRPGFLNVDMDPVCEPDVLIVDNDFSVLPRRYFQSVVAHDVLEHIPRSKTMSALLEWVDLMVPGGTMDVETSSILGVAARMAGQPYATQHGWTICLFGNQAHPGDYHYTGFTDATLLTHLLAAGLQPGPISTREGWLISARATKEEDWTSLLEREMDDGSFVAAAYRAAFDREADADGHTACVEWLSGGVSRRVVLKHLFCAEERLYRTAAKHGL
jgi:hypothetical protein